MQLWLYIGEIMYHFFIQAKQVSDNKIYLEGGDVNHIKNVLRMKTGDKISLTDEDGTGYTCSILNIYRDEIEVEILSSQEVSHELSAKITLFQGLPKGDKFETIIQKAVELGACEIVPVITKRCVVKLDDKKKENKIRRWNVIAESAAKQSKRTYIPKVRDVISFSEAVNLSKDFDMVCIPYEQAEGMSATKEFLMDLGPDIRIAVYIGPEGGFEEYEIREAESLGITPISLGKRVLRTETAGMALLSMIMLNLECQAEENLQN